MKKEFIRVRSVKDIVIFTSIIILGCTLIALPTGTGVNITGFFLIFAGLILTMVLRTGHKDTETGDSYYKKEVYFQQAMYSDVLDAVKSNPSSIDLSQKDKGSALKVDIYFSKATGKAYVRMFECVPYKYQPCSDMYEYGVNNVTELIK